MNGLSRDAMQQETSETYYCKLKSNSSLKMLKFYSKKGIGVGVIFLCLNEWFDNNIE